MPRKPGNPMDETKSLVTTSVSLRRQLYDRWCKRLPKYGDRTKVLTILMEKFLNGEITVEKTY